MAKAKKTRPKMSLFLDSAVHDRMKELAAEADLSLTRYIERLVVKHYEAKGAKRAA